MPKIEEKIEKILCKLGFHKTFMRLSSKVNWEGWKQGVPYLMCSRCKKFIRNL